MRSCSLSGHAGVGAIEASGRDVYHFGIDEPAGVRFAASCGFSPIYAGFCACFDGPAACLFDAAATTGLTEVLHTEKAPGPYTTSTRVKIPDDASNVPVLMGSNISLFPCAGSVADERPKGDVVTKWNRESSRQLVLVSALLKGISRSIAVDDYKTGSYYQHIVRSGLPEPARAGTIDSVKRLMKYRHLAILSDNYKLSTGVSPPE